MAGHSETAFEIAIEHGLTARGGYAQRSPADFNEDLCLFPADVLGFIRDTQAQKWDQLEALLKGQTADQMLSDLTKELATKGTLHVLRHGFRCYGKTLRLAYFQPNTGMNPETTALYAKNRLTITRQVAFTSVKKAPGGKAKRCILDVTLAVNGLPVVTAELKNQLTGQRAADAKTQYERDRDERDLMFKFKERALVHFAVDPDEVWMTTRLKGGETFFLPFNKGHNRGAGNPPVEGNWKTAYLWDEVLARDSLLDILQRFMHLEVKEKKIATDRGPKTVRKETMVFPRYHQLDAVRKLVAHAKTHGAGRNYLIQHSAGSPRRSAASRRHSSGVDGHHR
ncbi:type I restriction and modification enzyme subunit R-like protein [Rhodovulum steppense]|uniref:Type I restriction and modification enzyme subunit R-like protein n=1 Tax=Rhodovulum steppense TaxID=540251 RepID=A0A4R1YGY2_9RHOB|nr:type I restriction and modification enzyme subunit R-like protein [Rhodovulum steppense]